MHKQIEIDEISSGLTMDLGDDFVLISEIYCGRYFLGISYSFNHKSYSFTKGDLKEYIEMGYQFSDIKDYTFDEENEKFVDFLKELG